MDKAAFTKLQRSHFIASPDLARCRVCVDLQILCWAINEKTEYCAFYEYSGNANRIDITVADSKKHDREDVFNLYLSFEYGFYVRETHTELDPYEAYQYIRKELFDMLPQGYVPGLPV